MSKPERKCEWCGMTLSHKPFHQTRFCNTKCSALWRNTHYPRRQQSKELLQKRRELIKRMHELPGMREKFQENLKRIRTTTPAGPTVPQKKLLDALPHASIEYAIPTSQSSKFVKIDLAIPPLQLAIEIDGHSHGSQKGKAEDATKEQFLKERGWTLLRFRNHEILRNLPSVLKRIETMAASLQKRSSHVAVA